MEGIPLKPLFSVEDRVLRRFMAERKSVELKKTLIEVLGLTAGEPDKIKATLLEYANSLFFIRNTDGTSKPAAPAMDDREKAMREEYELMRNVRPQIKMSKDGYTIHASFEPTVEPQKPKGP